MQDFLNSQWFGWVCLILSQAVGVVLGLTLGRYAVTTKRERERDERRELERARVRRVLRIAFSPSEVRLLLQVRELGAATFPPLRGWSWEASRAFTLTAHEADWLCVAIRDYMNRHGSTDAAWSLIEHIEGAGGN